MNEPETTMNIDNQPPARSRAPRRRWSVHDFTELIPHPYGEMGLWPAPICGRTSWVPPSSRKKTKPAPPAAGPAPIHAKIDS